MGKVILLPFLLIILLDSTSLGQRKRAHINTLWSDSTGSAEIQQSRKQFWDSLPDPLGLTTDFENVFSKDEIKKLDSIIMNYEKKTSIEFCVVTLDTMKINRERFSDLPDYIEKSWGIGKKETQNGIVICLSVGYRSIRIGTGSGIEDYLSEKETNQIIQKNILPDFKKKKYFEGTLNGIIAITEVLDKKMKKSSASR